MEMKFEVVAVYAIRKQASTCSFMKKVEPKKATSSASIRFQVVSLHDVHFFVSRFTGSFAKMRKLCLANRLLIYSPIDYIINGHSIHDITRLFLTQSFEALYHWQPWKC